MCMGFFISSINAQNLRVTGKVTSQLDGTSLPGVSIVIKGTTQGTTTDIDGNYSIEVPQGAVLQFSFLGMIPKEVTIQTSGVYNMILLPDLIQMEEVIVTGLGIKRAEKSLGYAVSYIDSKKITSVASPNFGAALYGKASGVRIQAAPGGSTSAVSINVRGWHSVTGKNRPLIIIDGIPFRNDEANDYYNWGGARIEGNGILDINPEDIENISILKGASASALYGSDGMNGVIMITTKSGKGAKKGLGVDVSIANTWDNLAFEPNWQNTYGPGYGMYYFLNVGGTADGFITNLTYRSNMFQGQPVTVGETIIDPRTERPAIRAWNNAWGNFGPKMTGQDVLWWDGEFRNLTPQPSNFRDLYRTGTNKKYNVSVTQGSDNASFRFSFTRDESTPIQVGGNHDKNSFSLNTNMKISDKLTTDLIVNYYDISVKNRPIITDGLSGYQYNRSEKADLVKKLYKTSKGYQYTTTVATDPDEFLYYAPSSAGYMSGILWNQLENNFIETTNRLVASSSVVYNPISWLSAKVQLGTDLNAYNTENMQKNTVPAHIGNSGSYSISNSRFKTNYGLGIITFKQNFGDIDFSLNAAFTAKYDESKYTYAGTNGGLVQENWFSINNSVNSNKNTDARRTYALTYAYYTFANLAYKEWAFAEITLRHEYTSFLPPADNSFTYPSFNSSILLNEALSLPSYFDLAKVRLAWGMVGNSPGMYIANNAYNQGTINSVPYSYFDYDYGNDRIKSEKKTEYEFGLDTRLFNNRIMLDVGYYKNIVDRLIIQQTVASSTGSSKMLTNVGKISNQGIELGLTLVPVRTSNLQWTLALNGGWNKNRVEKLIDDVEYLELNWEGAGSVLIVAQEGKPYGEILTYSHLRDDQGRKIVDGEGYWVRDESQMISVGNITPKFIGGIGNTITYKSISLDFLIDYRIGGDILSMTNYYGMNGGKLDNTLDYRDQESGGLPYWINNSGQIIPGTNVIDSQNKYNGRTNSDGTPFDGIFWDGMILDGVNEDGTPNETIISSADYWINMYYWKYGFHEYAIYDNSYIKFRELALNFNVPSKYINKIGVQRLMVSLIGRNLFYIWKNVPNIDPESAVGTTGYKQGIEYGFVPPTRTWGFAARLSF